MKRMVFSSVAVLPLVVVVVAWLLFPYSASSQGVPSTKPQEDMLRAWSEAFLTEDVEKVLAFYVDSEKVLSIDSNGRTWKGRNKVRKFYEESFKWGPFGRHHARQSELTFFIDKQRTNECEN